MDLSRPFSDQLESDADTSAYIDALSDGSSGPDLEYDNRWLAFSTAREGKAETQFSAAEPPNWRKVTDMARDLLSESRDLRVAVALAQAKLNLQGLVSLPESLRLMAGMLTNQWSTLNPVVDPDDGDPYARLNALEEMALNSSAWFKDFRNAVAVQNSQLGVVYVRHFEYALERSPAPEGEEVYSRAQLEGMLMSNPEEASLLSALVEGSLAGLDAIVEALDSNGVESYRHPDFSAAKQCLKNIRQVLPDPSALGGADASGDDDTGGTDSASSAGGGGGAGSRAARVEGINSRADAVKAIDLICAYLEREEPTNPATLLLKRARRLIDKDFIRLIKELAPDAASEVARVLGVDLSNYEDNEDSY